MKFGDALPLWDVPKPFTNRDQWSSGKMSDTYRKLISGPMTVVGQYRNAEGQPSLLPALVRYVECKCLLGGVTTSQGIKLASNAGVQRFYRGLIRNVEQTDEPDLPEAQGRIPDIAAKISTNKPVQAQCRLRLIAPRRARSNHDDDDLHAHQRSGEGGPAAGQGHPESHVVQR
jgi:hypothetical protein